MAAYFIVNIRITDRKRFHRYSQAAPAVVEHYGGRYIVRGGDLEILEGDWQPELLVVLEFPSMALARRFYESEEYRPLLALRQASTESQVVLVDGR